MNLNFEMSNVNLLQRLFFIVFKVELNEIELNEIELSSYATCTAGTKPVIAAAHAKANTTPNIFNALINVLTQSLKAKHKEKLMKQEVKLKLKL